MRSLIGPLLTFQENSFENVQVLLLLFLFITAVLIIRIPDNHMLGSGSICTNCHISGVGLGNTVVDSVYSTLCLRKVRIIWQKTGKSFPLLSQSVPSSGLQTRKPGNHISFCVKTIFFRQSDEPDFLLLSFFLFWWEVGFENPRGAQVGKILLRVVVIMCGKEDPALVKG